jgi:branched-chain amino acid aminotransferase
MKVWLDGELVEKEDAKLTVFDHGTLYGDGVFEGIRVYNGKVFQAEAHIDRLFVSADKIRLEIPYSGAHVLESIYQTLRANDLVDAYVRLVVTRGEGTLGLNPRKCPRPTVFIITDQIELYPQEMYDNGLAVIVARTVRTSRRMLDPSIKNLNYLNNIMAKIEAVEAGVEEAIMLNEAGHVAECTGDNIFIVKNGTIITPPPEAGILIGVTRGVAIRLAERLGIALVEGDLSVDELYAADECFLTGTAAEIISVTRIDDQTIGSGQAGPVTQKLLSAFREFIRSAEA